MRSVEALVAANLGLGLLQQLLVLYLVGGAAADVMYGAQAPFMVISAVAASIASNAFTPHFIAGNATSSSSPSLLALALPFGACVVVVSSMALATFAFAGSAFFASRIADHPQFAITLALFAAGCVAATMLGFLVARLSATGRALLAEQVQFATGVAAVAANPLLIANWGVAGAAASLALRPMLALVVCALLMRVELSAQPSRAQQLQALSILRQASVLIPSHAVQKCAPLVDRSFLGHAEPSWLTVYAISMQVVGAALAYFERTTTRKLLIALSRQATMVTRGWLTPTTAAAVLVGTAAIMLMYLSQLVSGESSPGMVSGLLPFLPIVPFCFFFVVFGAWTQVNATHLYAAGRLREIARLSVVSAIGSLLLRAVLFYLVGMVGLLIGALSHYYFSALLFARASRAPART